MAENDFNSKIIAAIEEKGIWFDTQELPKLQEDYRLHLTCVRNLFEAMVNKNLLTPDPYKKDKKISEIIQIENLEFTENERSVTLGIRFSDYESILDFVCNYMKFSTKQLDMEKIRKLLELNNTFTWSNLTENATRPNTRGLAICVKQLRNGAPPIILSLIKDTTHKSAEAIKEINDGLKALAEYQKESYKVEVRKNVFGNPSFSMQTAMSSPAAMLSEIRKHFASSMPKRHFAEPLIQEIIAEELGTDKEERQAKLLAAFVQEKKSAKKEETVDTHEILMEAIRTLGSSADQIGLVCRKFIANSEILQSEHNTFKDKMARFFRNMLGLQPPPVIYNVIIVDKKTEAKKRQTIQFTDFIDSLSKRARYFSSFSVKHTPGYTKIASAPEEKALEFLLGQMADCNRILNELEALDDFFKNEATAVDRTKIKGIKMELTAIKNVLIKVNQHRAEYISYKEEQEQMRKLGIIGDA
ncbi:hypothetical protein [Treponema sp.]|uniref:hypothetical protein n=1 Tax=Treponema sp. TaxID=166 RepID=UPI0025E7047A|nr:hypothetical protein [Treponema sp.]MCR5219087.1 hypothetical protein [Treponema sp.]